MHASVAGILLPVDVPMVSMSVSSFDRERKTQVIAERMNVHITVDMLMPRAAFKAKLWLFDHKDGY